MTSRLSAASIAVILFVSACESLPLIAETALFSSPATEKTRPEVDRICSLLAGGRVMRGTFTQKKEIKSLSRSFNGSGTFVISSGDGIIWTVVKPFPSETVVNGTRIAQTSAQGKTSTLDAGQNPAFSEFAETIQSVFAGNPERLFSHFDVYYLPAKNGAWQIGLVPKDGAIRSVISSMVLCGTACLDNFLMAEPSGDTVAYVFTEQSFSGELTDEEQKKFAR